MNVLKVIQQDSNLITGDEERVTFESNPLCRQGLEIIRTVFLRYDCAEPMLGKYVYISQKKQQRWNCVMYRCSWMWVSSHWSILHHPYQACLSFSVSVLMLSTYPSPDPTLTPTLLSIDFCWVRGGGRWAVAQILKLILLLHPPHHQYVPISIYISVYSFFPHSQKRL